MYPDFCDHCCNIDANTQLTELQLSYPDEYLPYTIHNSKSFVRVISANHVTAL